jgi:hypothetical protein
VRIARRAREICRVVQPAGARVARTTLRSRTRSKGSEPWSCGLQMVEFIKQEATEKANEIRVAADEVRHSLTRSATPKAALGFGHAERPRPT